jgi:hypothetical protein
MNKSNNDFTKLKEVGIEKIVNDTYISNDTIQAIFNQDFVYFETPVKALKFIKILNSYYDLDLSNWIDDYNLYRDTNMLEATVEKEDNLISLEDEPKKDNYGMYLIISIIAISILILISIIPTSQENISTNVNTNTTTVIVDELQEVLNKKPNNTKYKVNKKTLAVVTLKRNRHTQQLTQEEMMHNELNPEISDLLDRDIIIDLNKSILSIHNNDITIKSTLGRMWVGIIDVDTYDKRADIIDGEKTFPIYDNTIFITGHGHLKISSGEEEYSIESGQKQYFYYKDKSFVKLKKIEYLHINKGIEW